MQKFSPKFISKRDFLFTNNLVGKFRPFYFSTKNCEKAFLSFERPSCFNSNFGFKIKCWDKFLEIWLESFPFDLFLDNSLKKLNIDDIPADAKLILLEHSLKPILENFESFFKTTFSLESILESVSTKNENEDKLFFSINSQNNKIFGNLLCDRNIFYKRIFPFLFKQKTETYKENITDINFVLDIQIGQTTLQTKEFSNLEINDIILIEEDFSLEENTVLLKSKGISCKAKLENNELKILSIMITKPEENDEIDTISEDELERLDLEKDNEEDEQEEEDDEDDEKDEELDEKEEDDEDDEEEDEKEENEEEDEDEDEKEEEEEEDEEEDDDEEELDEKDDEDKDDEDDEQEEIKKETLKEEFNSVKISNSKNEISKPSKKDDISNLQSAKSEERKEQKHIKENEHPKTNASENSKIDIKSVPINLLFEVGQQTISMKELQTLREGFVFETTHSLEKSVYIRANGKKIGVGEIVKLSDDRVGVRIIEFIS